MSSQGVDVYKSKLLLELERLTTRDWKADVMDTGIIVVYAPPSRTNRNGKMNEEDISILEKVFEEIVSEYGFIIPCIEKKRSEIFNKIKSKK